MYPRDLTFDQARVAALAMAHEAFEKLMAAVSSSGVVESEVIEAERVLKNDLFPLIDSYSLLRKTRGIEQHILALALFSHILLQAESGNYEVARGAKRVFTRQLAEVDFLKVIEIWEPIPSTEEPKPVVVQKRRKEKKAVTPKPTITEEPFWLEELRKVYQKVEESPDRISKIRALISLADDLMNRAASTLKEAHKMAVEARDSESVAESALKLSGMLALTSEEQLFYAEIAARIYDKLRLGDRSQAARTRISSLQHYLTGDRVAVIQEDVTRSSSNYSQFF
ncbi:MAG: hypothetical protein M1150_03050 [Patescibacteria group bacterium]|nr:hypothetical protein [Patescibacteria group bacterium]